MTEPIVVATGSYSSHARGRGRGVELLAVDPGTASVERLAGIDLEDPSFLTWSADGSLLHVVQETSPTRLTTLRVDPRGTGVEVAATLELTGSGGCHVAPGTTAGTLLVTDYGSGHVEVVGLDDEGLPDRVLDVCDHGAYRKGADSHPHQSQVLPGTGLIAVSDLGLDSVYVYSQGADGGIDLAGELSLTRDRGPRHLATDHESRNLYLACELSGELAVAERRTPASDGAGPTWGILSEQPASGSATQNFASHVELSGSEDHVFIANRGPDSLSVFSLGPSRPELVDEIEVGAHPRHFARLGSLLLVAAQEADRIDLVRFDGRTLGTAAEPVASPSVCCIVPRP